VCVSWPTRGSICIPFFISLALALFVYLDRKTYPDGQTDLAPKYARLTLVADLYIFAILFLGLDSMWFHASLKEWGGVTDFASVFAYAAFLVFYSALFFDRLPVNCNRIQVDGCGIAMAVQIVDTDPYFGGGLSCATSHHLGAQLAGHATQAAENIVAAERRWPGYYSSGDLLD
jgi:hypothetical protein